MNLQAARELQEELENDIQELIEKFEKKTGTVVQYIDIERLDTRTFDEKERRYKNFINRITTSIEL